MKTSVFFMLGVITFSGFPIGLASAHEPKHRQCNNPGDEVIDGNVDKEHLILSGRVGRLIINGKVDGQSTLDLRGLSAGVVFIRDRVDGQSTVLIGNTGVVQIGDKIDGQSIVQIGNVVGAVQLGDKIDGQSRVAVNLCQDFIVGGKIDGGPGTVVIVNYTRTLDIKGGVQSGSVTFSRR